MQSAMTGSAWLFLLGNVAMIAWALWMAWMGISSPHKAFREGGHAPGAAGSFDAHSASQPQAATGGPTGHVA